MEFGVLPDLPDEITHECDIYEFFNILQSPWQNLLLDIRNKEKYSESHARYTINIPPNTSKNDTICILKKDIQAQQNIIAHLYIYSDTKSKQIDDHFSNILNILKDECVLFPELFVCYDQNSSFIQKYPFLCIHANDQQNEVDAEKEEKKEDETTQKQQQKYRQMILSIVPKISGTFSQLYTERIGDHLEYPNIIIDDRLFLGDYNAATRKKIMKDLKISHIVDCTREPNEFEHDNALTIKYFQVPVLDTDTDLIALYFDAAIAFIDNAIESNASNKVFIHCRAGVSRSSTVTIAYLMKAHNMNIDVALKYVQERRSCIEPNEGFRIQLHHFENNRHKVNRQALLAQLNDAVSKKPSLTPWLAMH